MKGEIAADLELMREPQSASDNKIAMLVMDSLGGLLVEPGGSTELEAAQSSDSLDGRFPKTSG